MLNGTMCAEVAELADAQDLGSCGRKAVGVQLPPSASLFYKPGKIRFFLILDGLGTTQEWTTVDI